MVWPGLAHGQAQGHLVSVALGHALQLLALDGQDKTLRAPPNPAGRLVQAQGQHVAKALAADDLFGHEQEGVRVAKAQLDAVGVAAVDDAALVALHGPGDGVHGMVFIQTGPVAYVAEFNDMGVGVDAHDGRGLGKAHLALVPGDSREGPVLDLVASAAGRQGATEAGLGAHHVFVHVLNVVEHGLEKPYLGVVGMHPAVFVEQLQKHVGAVKRPGRHKGVTGLLQVKGLAEAAVGRQKTVAMGQ